MTTKTPWQEIRLPQFPKLESDTRCDVLVVGGGLTGLTTAYLMAKAGKDVILLERDRLGGGDTGCTTAHLTMVTDARISELVDAFGSDGARLVWEAGLAAIYTIEGISRQESIECEFRRIPGFFHAALDSQADETQPLQTDARLAGQLGFAATYLDAVPRLGKPGIRFPNQAKFHPMKYLAGLAKAVEQAGGRIFEQSEATEFSEKPRGARAAGRRIDCDFIVIATHVPLTGVAGWLGSALLQTKLVSYSSYAIGAQVPHDTFPEASFWDTASPYHYLRIDRGERHDYAIFGGEDHKTGQAHDQAERFARLSQQLTELTPKAKVDRYWSGQVVETHDGLPYIGETAPGQFVATGFAGNGMTFGTLAAMMACDAVQGRTNPWRELFAVERKKLGGVLDFVKENFDFPYYLIRDRFAGGEAESTRQVQRGQGKILKQDGERIACSRDDEGNLNCVSAVCTHMGCIVHWNGAEKTWDCPCHGSRFLTTGEVLAGPAEKGLKKVEPPRAKSATPHVAKSSNGRSTTAKR